MNASSCLGSGLKAQQAHSPGHCPGYVYRREVRPARAKASEHKRFVSMLLPLQGALHCLNPPRAMPWAMRLLHKIGCARHSSSKLGFALTCTIFAPLGRTLNACFPLGTVLFLLDNNIGVQPVGVNRVVLVALRLVRDIFMAFRKAQGRSESKKNRQLFAGNRKSCTFARRLLSGRPSSLPF